MHHIRPASAQDAIGFKFRWEDWREVRDSSGMNPSEAVAACIDPYSSWTWLTEKHGPVAIFGVSHVSEGVGAPWLVGTDHLKDYQIYFLRNCRQWISLMHERYPRLTNCVDERNEIHLRWLHWCGFKFTNLHPKWGAAKLPFWEFEKTVNV